MVTLGSYWVCMTTEPVIQCLNHQKPWMNSNKDSAQIRSSPMTSFKQHLPSQRSSCLSGPDASGHMEWSCEPSDICVCVSLCACRIESGSGDTNIHQSSWALVQSCSLKCRRGGLLQNTNVFWKRKRIFKGKPSLIFFLHSQGQKSGIPGIG